MKQIKKSVFRQTGWKELATGEIHEFYEGKMPVQDGSFIKLWDNLISVETTVEPFTEQPEGIYHEV